MYIERQNTVTEHHSSTSNPDAVATLVRAARTEFSAKGFSATEPETVVARAGVPLAVFEETFGEKRALFRAAVEDAHQELQANVSRAAGASRDQWGELVDGCRAFLDTAIQPTFSRVVLEEGPAVLGWDTWREVESAHVVQQLEITLSKLVSAGLVRKLPMEALAHLLAGALNEAALWISRSGDPSRARVEAWETFESVLDALRAPGH